MSDVKERIDALVKANEVVLFMKGSALFPQCGFSSRPVAILDRLGVPFETVDVLADPGAVPVAEADSADAERYIVRESTPDGPDRLISPEGDHYTVHDVPADNAIRRLLNRPPRVRFRPVVPVVPLLRHVVRAQQLPRLQHLQHRPHHPPVLMLHVNAPW